MRELWMPSLSRRRLLLALAGAALALSACAPLPKAEVPPPIVFVHGNGDSAALWTTTLWRYESNGWPADRLVALNMPNPSARDDDTVAQANRSSAEEQRRYLAEQVDALLARTGARQLVLVANSRGGNTVRNFIEQGGAPKVSHAVLGGTPNHGVWANPGFRPNNEFNGAGPLLTRLNAPKGPKGDEVTPGPKWLTLRSDNNDLFAQPDGRFIGAPGTPTNVTADGPALKGATNVVLPGLDHREVSYHPLAFAKTFEFITGRAPRHADALPQERVRLAGFVTGLEAGGYTNQGVASVPLEVYAVDASGQRQGAALLSQTTAADGRWGPLNVASTQALEFVFTVPGHATMHIYRNGFARSSDIVHLRPQRLTAADRGGPVAVVSLQRPRGYFSLPRDRIVLDGVSPPAGIPTGVAAVAQARLQLKEGVGREVAAEFNGTRIAGRAWPVAQNRLVVLELHP
jgi:triacylglycerol lipase